MFVRLHDVDRFLDPKTFRVSVLVKALFQEQSVMFGSKDTRLPMDDQSFKLDQVLGRVSAVAIVMVVDHHV